MSYEDNQQEEEATQFQNDDLQEPDEEQDNSFLSIWDMVGTYAQSPLETMLSKENAESITLEQVLDEETVIQEVKGANAKVIEFLQRKEHIQKIIEYLITEHYKEDESATTTTNEEEYNKKVYKFPYIAAEIISCDVDEINDKIVDGDENVMKLFSFLHNKNRSKTPINPFLSQYFTKALSTLVQKYYSRIVTTLISQDSEKFDVLKSLFVENMALPDMDILALKLLGFETSDDSAFFGGGEGEFGGLASQQKLKELFMMKQRGNDKLAEENKKKMQQWSMDKGIVSLLIQKVESDLSDDDAARNVFSVLTEIVEKGNSVIHSKILAKETLERILTIILTSPQSNIYMSGLTFLRTVIDASDMYSDGTNVPEALAIIHNRTKDFVEMLTNEKQEQVTITTTHGTLSPPLGEKRLKTVDHLQLLFKSSYKSIHLDLIQLKALDRLLDLFFTYEYNNMLHCAVFSIIRHIIEGTSTEELKTALIKDCKIIERMIATHNKNEQVVQEHKGQRLGNMGHIIEISNLLKRVSSQPESTIGQLVKEVAGWTDFVNGPLAEINAVNDRQLGGPPPIGGSNQMMSNSMFQFGNEEDDDDDDGVFVDEDDSDSDSDDDEDDVVVKKEGEEKSEYQQIGSMSTANALGGGEDWGADFEDAEF